MNIRTFIAIELKKEIKDKLIEAQHLFQDVYGKFNWIKPEQMHLTVRFLGSIPENKIEQIHSAMVSASRGISPFELEFSNLGCFPNPSFPRVLWIGVEQSPSLKLLHKQLEEELIKLDFEPETREFTPHLTIARIKSRIDTEKFKQILKSHENFPAGKQRIERWAIFSSQLKPTGSIYTKLREVSF